MSGPSVIFVLDELRRQQEEDEMGVMVGLGPGLTVETMVLRATVARRRFSTGPTVPVVVTKAKIVFPYLHIN
ncbi:hypothetical protein SEVIR_9G141300v4 [Setaria viridis]|uniref:Chalcone/stilbene synthase C-terminal domain-containing protein n=1 Tax=Setaria viridis TaxID=4556 RepID=A0A4U6ST93_SETVI|nr:hypothetical protein SEVIR_9G141300v2 [Setaria viridis]TKV92098.1 hypothetical protein SEVIR_9G141300v2 [Setaria viridis]